MPRNGSATRRAAVLVLRAALAGLITLGAVACSSGAAHRDDCKKPGVCFPGGPTPPLSPAPTPP